MIEPLISIIIPVYNVEKYLDYCVKSVFAQSYQNLDIILVDDGATDSSGRMCDEYAEKDKRVRVIHKQNGGLSSARNAGLSIMKGEYLTFIDSDDYVRFDYIRKMYDYITTDQTDLVVCMFKKTINEIDFRSIIEHKPEHYVFSREEIKYKILSRQIPSYAHGKLFKASLAKFLVFPEGRLFEDVPTIWNVIKYIDRATYATDPLYYYRQRADSIINIRFNHGRMDQLYFSQDILKEFEDKKDKYYYAAVSRCFFSAVDNYSIVTKDFPDDYKGLERFIEKYSVDVLKDKNAEFSLKVMAMLAVISPKLTRFAGREYKKYKYKNLLNNS